MVVAYGYGRGGGRGGFNNVLVRCKEEPWKLYPEISEYPTVDLAEIDKEYKNLVSWGNNLQKFWLQSCYHVDDARQGIEKNGGRKRPPLSDFMKMTDDYVPAELVAKNARRNTKKVRWDPESSDLQRLDDFVKLDHITKGQEDDDDEKKEDEDEDEEEDNENVEQEEEVDDYIANFGFDDDEDDFNPGDDGGDDEGYY